MDFPSRLIPAAAAACLLVACGGGSSGDGGGTAPPPVAFSGVAVDGYLVGATVLCDANDNGQTDPGELGAGTNANGVFVFTLGCTSPLVVTGGSSADTGLPFTGTLRAPAGATVVSPLTTLIVAGLPAQRVLAALGLPAAVNLLTTDPAAGTVGQRPNINLLRATLAAQQLLQKSTELFTGLGGVSSAASRRAVYTEVAAAFAAELGSAGTLVTGTTADAALIARLVAAAATRLRSASTVGAAVPAALSTLNPEALGAVVAGGMAVQAGRLLAASDAGLSAVTTDQQEDLRITDFAVANRAALASAPSADTTALGVTLTDIIGGAVSRTDYLALTGDAIELVDGANRSSLGIAQFQSPAGVSVAWPVSPAATLSVGLTEIGSYALPSDMKLTAAISITDNAAGGQGELQAFIDDVRVAKTASGLRITVPATSRALVYGVSADGRKKSVIDFSNSVAGITNTLRTAGAANSIVFGEVVDFAINRLGQDFTGIDGLRGSYSVSVVISGLPIRRADGTSLPAVTVTVPTAIDAQGNVTTSRAIAGPGLVGTITLTD